MTGIFASKAVAGKPRCARCGRPFTPRKEGDLYGPKCARIAQAAADYAYEQLVEGKALIKGKEKSVPIFVKDHHGGISEVIV